VEEPRRGGGVRKAENLLPALEHVEGNDATEREKRKKSCMDPCWAPASEKQRGGPNRPTGVRLPGK